MKIRQIYQILFCTLILSASGFAQSPQKTSFDLNSDLGKLDVDQKSGLIVQNSDGQKKSVFLAVVLSLALPGAGEFYAGGYSRGKYFTISEATLWGMYAGFEVYGNALQRDARSFAKVNAGIDETGKGDQFYVDIGNFDNTDEYNVKKMRDRTPDLLYDANAGYGWQWNSEANREEYRTLRVSSDNVLYNSRYVIGGIIVNHLISAISAGKAAADYNKSLASRWDWRLLPEITMLSGIPDGVQLRFETNF